MLTFVNKEVKCSTSSLIQGRKYGCYTLLRTGKSGLELGVKLSNWITATAAAAAADQ